MLNIKIKVNMKQIVSNTHEPQCTIFGVVCRLFHKIETIDKCHFVDKVDGRSVGKYRCTKCGRTYLANHKRSWYRCYV